MIIKNQEQISELTYLIPPVLNMFGVSEEQNEIVLKKVFGLQLKKMRLMRGYTQTRVAKAIKVTFQQIQKYEKGVNAVSVINELKFCEFFDCDRGYFVQPITENGYKFLKQKKNKLKSSLKDNRSEIDGISDMTYIEERNQFYHKRKREKNDNQE